MQLPSDLAWTPDITVASGYGNAANSDVERIVQGAFQWLVTKTGSLNSEGSDQTGILERSAGQPDET
jgi:hypothetical protein